MNSEFSRFDELISRYLDAELPQPEGAELVALLGDPPLAKRFLETTQLNSEIAGLLAAPVPDAAMVELVRADIEKSLARERVTDGEHLHLLKAAQPSRPAWRRRKLVWQRLAWAAVFVMFAGAAVLFVNRTQMGEAPRIASVQGEVRLVTSGGERALTVGEQWRPNEELKTVGSNSAAMLTFRDGSQLAFRADTSAVNQSGNQRHRVELKHGVVQAVVQKQRSGRPFVFATQQAEAIVVGTALRLVVESHLTRLEVTEGTVRFRRLSDGAEVTVSTGQYASAAPNVPLAAQPIAQQPHHVQ